MKNWKKTISLPLALLLLAGCGQAAASGDGSTASSDGSAASTEGSAYMDEVALQEVVLEDEAIALADGPSGSSMLVAVASGTVVEKNEKAVIDYSNTKDGYVMVNYTAAASQRLKVQVTGPTTTYTYNLTPGSWATFPLSDGNGEYKITVFENVTDAKYAAVLSATCQVALSDEFAPFLRPNQYVDYAVASNTIVKAKELAGNIADPIEKVEAVYKFVVENLTYDKEKAATVESGYLPVLDNVLATKKGICFDYAALMTGMLRSQGVPCKLVVGYAGTAYHAWISVWTQETGWVEGIVYFDGKNWQRMDPTFASSSNSSDSVMQFIGDGTNYTSKYLY